MSFRTHLQSSVHDYCAHKTGFMLVIDDHAYLDDSGNVIDASIGGWSWHRTIKGAQNARDRMGREGHGGKIFRILGDDHTELVQGV